MSKNAKNNPYPWRTMPAAYGPLLRRTFFRLETLKYAVINAVAETRSDEFLLTLKQHLLHLDTVLDQVWEEARVAVDEDKMDQNWRSLTLDKWLVVEYHLQRHHPFNVEAFQEEEPGKLDDNPFDLGLIFLFILKC
jgi:hypothetical protein